MRFISYLLLLIFMFSCDCRRVKDLPGYKSIEQYSEKIQSKMELILCGYAVNQKLPKDYEFTNDFASFSASYVLCKKKCDTITVEEARVRIVALVNLFLQELNADKEIRSQLEIYPMTHDRLNITIYFKDENGIDLGQGISEVSYSHSEIKYERYEIYEYRDKPPARGRHFLQHQETYEDAASLCKGD